MAIVVVAPRMVVVLLGAALQLSQLLAAAASSAQSTACKSDVDCSFNGVCSSTGACQCDKPWTGPACGVLGYKTTPASGRSLYPESDPRNTWNGAILCDSEGVYHLYNPLFPVGELGNTTTLLHGTSHNITGPYLWGKQPDIIIPRLGPFDGPKSVVYTEAGKTKYSLWLGGHVYLANHAAGPFTMLEGFTYPGHNPAPIYHKGAFYTIVSMTGGIMTTPRLVTGAKWSQYSSISHANVPTDWIPEDPDMFVDKRGNWHIVNHAYDNHEWENCGTSVLSSHFYSTDGQAWHFLPQAIQPYSHTVRYDDGTSHLFVTMERPNLFFDGRGQLTHIHLAADLVTGAEGCGNRTGPHGGPAHFGHTPCDNCKYEDHGGTTIISLEV